MSLESQTNRNFEIVISDDSEDDLIKNFLATYKCEINIRYVKNLAEKKCASTNLNNAIKQAKYDIIKPIFQDDYIINENMINDIILSEKNWGVLGWKNSTSMKFSIVPRWNKRILCGKNTVGCPTGIFFKKNDALYFDENLINMMDCEFYYKLHELYGDPFIMPTAYYVMRVWEGSITSTLVTEQLQMEELHYLQSKHHKKHLVVQYLFYVKGKDFLRKITPMFLRHKRLKHIATARVKMNVILHE
jgi:glycosyltransferase involved in cell wall biosynthesis